MMAVNTPVNIQEFDEFIRLPENADKRFEYIHGEILELVSNSYSSLVAGEIYFYIKLHMKNNNIKGYATVPDGGYKIGNERYMPDIGYISASRQPEPPRETYISTTPDLVVEVLSPTDNIKSVRLKIGNYLAENVVVWVVDPEDETVEVYRPGKAVVMYKNDEVIDGSPVFPDLKLPVNDIFPKVDTDEE
jgi:Uma2 family endonuclease